MSTYDITRERAEEIAKDFIDMMNPSHWNGIGRKPKDVDTRIATYDFESKINNEIDISIEKDEGEWTHYCELRDKDTGDLMGCCHGYGIDSILNLADTIEDVCNY